MRVLIDTNVLFSALLNGVGMPHAALEKAMAPPNRAVVCEQSITELRSAHSRKFPNAPDALQDFLDYALPCLEVVKVPPGRLGIEARIRDATDRPILRAAIMEKVDVIVTGDKDFLESGITMPIIVTPAEFVHGQRW